MHLGAATLELQWQTTLTFVSPADGRLGRGERSQERLSQIEALQMVEVLNASDNHQSSPMRRIVIPGVTVAAPHPLTLAHELGGSTAPSALGAKGNDCAVEIDDGDLGNLMHGLGLDDVEPDLGDQLHVQNVGCRAREGGAMVHSNLS